MNQHLQNIREIIQQDNHLSDEQKDTLLKSVKAAEKEFEITSFKLERTEKVKRTTAILLEETIDELEKKRKDIEKHNRELEIEAALERIRAASMAMHHSEELPQVALTVLNQIEALDIPHVSCSINIVDNQTKDFISYSANSIGSKNQKVIDQLPLLNLKDIGFMREVVRSKKSWGPYNTLELRDENLKEMIDLWKASNFSGTQNKYVQQIPDVIYLHWAPFNDWSSISLNSVERLTYEQLSVLARMANTFSLSYTRFLDLQKAEAQTREAEIQLALERVRARTMAMRKSDELQDVVAILYEQLNSLSMADLGFELILCDEEKEILEYWHTNPFQSSQPQSYKCNKSVHPFFKQQWNAWKHQNKRLIITQENKEKEEFENILFLQTDFKHAPKETKKFIKKEKLAVFSHVTMKYGLLEAVGAEPISEENFKILERFSNSFEQTYTRFLDLQKAEAQAREAQIEAGLERVRSRTMAMHRSDELAEVSIVLYDELNKLGIKDFVNCGFNEIDEEKESQTGWPTLTDGSKAEPYHLPLKGDHILDERYEIWKSGALSFSQSVGGAQLKKHLKFVFKTLGSKQIEELVIENFPNPTVFNFFFFKQGYLDITTNKRFSEEDEAILIRFAKAFEQAYTRFLDLQKAEAQTREAQIEAALERVRSRAMGMQKSDELTELNAIIIQQIKILNIPLFAVGIHICDPKKPATDAWIGNLLDGQMPKTCIDHSQDPLCVRMYRGWKENKDFVIDVMEGEALKEHFRNMAKIIPNQITFEEFVPPDKLYFHLAYFSYGFFTFTTEKPCPEDQSTFKRFAKVFEQTYTRFLDLQKAEKQAREAQIEAALERVRARTMAMQQSSELNDISVLLYKEIMTLGVSNFFNCGYFEMHEDEKAQYGWLTRENGTSLGKLKFPLKGDHTLDTRYDAWKKQKPLFHQVLNSVQMKKHIAFISPHYNNKEADEVVKLFPNPTIFYNANFKHGYLHFNTGTYIDNEGESILIRFTQVFAQSYTRFLDLQKAEAQAREAQIEASLEKIRARAMAMQKSDELREVVGLVSEELNISLENTICIIMNFDWQSKEIEWWSTGFNVDNLPESYKIPIHDTIRDHPLIRHYQEAVKKGIPYKVYKLEGEIKQSWDNYIFEQSDLKKIPLETQNWMRSYEGVICNEAFMSHGVLEVDGPEQLSDEKAEVLQRFAKVVDLTYKRIEDLQQAEARAVEAVRQASLDRVRGEIASMRTSKDLNRITPVIWRELQALEVPFFRCGVFIVDEKEQKVQVYLTTPEGKALGVLNLKHDANELTKNTVEHWRKKRIFRAHWNKQEFIDWTKSMVKMGQVQNAETYQGSAKAPESLNLHFVPFRQGMLYVGDVSPLTNEKIELVKTLAEAFSIAYARYEDFTNLEEAKNKIELTLNELKAAQTQLIQSEKMASLGELTAGIAHEIQNPLNFVNNFSEVSSELLEELKEEIENGNLDEVKVITSDLIQNLQKIYNHGQRASSIVKGMLLHSRGSSGQKEPTDINALCDEYLRLSYHGFRAKDKSFNADFKLEADDSLPKIEVVPQDFGRVLLNLINNAFYAVNEKAIENIEGYKPEVIVSTISQKSPSGDLGVKVTVKDNGSGIPEKVKEKIFQPFFTTKPTGQGTGLGLSLSYDIVKAHGGEFKVESKEGEGSEFIIQLPINTNP